MGDSLWNLWKRFESTLFTNPLKTRQELERLFWAAVSEGKESEALCLWPLLMKAIILSWDDFHLLDRYLDWFRENPVPGSFSLLPDLKTAFLSGYFGALLFREPENQELADCEQKLFSLVRRCERESIRLNGLFLLAVYAFWRGRLSRLHQIIDELGSDPKDLSPPGALLLFWIRAGENIWIHSDLEAADRELGKAAKLAKASGLFLWDHVLLAMKVMCALLRENISQAKRYLLEMKERLPLIGRHGRFHYFYLLGWLSFLKGDFNAAEIGMRRALEIAEETGYRFPYHLSCFALSQILFRKGCLPESLEFLLKCELFAKQTKSQAFLFLCFLFRSQLAYLSGDENLGRFYLSRGMKLGNRENYFQFIWWSNPQMMSFLCVRALEAGIEASYVRQFITKHRLRPPKGSRIPPDWPFPLRIHTLGGLEILKEGKPLQWSRKSPERPLALLLALISAHGTLDRERLIDLLWPEQEADSAYHSLESTLYRLRKLLGFKEVIISKGHRLHLQKELIFVDFWHFKEKLNELERAYLEENITLVYFLAEEVVSQYHEFLPGFEYPFVIFERESLKSRVFSLLKRVSEKIARHLPEKAYWLLERIWLLEPCNEELFRPLFEFLSQKAPNIALSTYERFETLLRTRNRTPSPEIRTLFEELQGLLEKSSPSA